MLTERESSKQLENILWHKNNKAIGSYLHYSGLRVCGPTSTKTDYISMCACVSGERERERKREKESPWYVPFSEVDESMQLY